MPNTSFVAALATATAMTLAFGYLYWRERERFLLLWAWASGLAVLRYALALLWASGGLVLQPWAVPVLAVARGFGVYWGGRALLDRGPSLGGWGVAVLAAGWAIAFRDTLDAPGALTVPYLTLAGGFLYGGGALLRSPLFQGGEHRAAAGSMMAYGLLQLAYPFSLAIPWIQPPGFALATALQAGIAASILLAFLRRRVQELDALGRAEELALTRALNEFISVCAHCKRVREEDGRHIPIQEYVEARTDALVSRVRCPRCAARLQAPPS